MNDTQLNYIRSKADFQPDTAIVLGSGLGGFSQETEPECIINFNEIPEFPVSTAPGHKGRFIFGAAGGEKIVCMDGRIHLYEGYSSKEVVMPIYLMRKMGAKRLILTNAGGGISKNLNTGDFMIIEDHISSFVPSPLVGENDDNLGPRFPDMSEVYSKRLNKIIVGSALKNNINIKKGVYIQFPGPAFETKAEIKMCAALGADAVGMSTAIEAQAAKYCGFEICAVSCITNLACGLLNKPITSDEVNETAERTYDKFKNLLIDTLGNISNEQY